MADEVVVATADLAAAVDRAALADLRAEWVVERRGVAADDAFRADFDSWLTAESGVRTFWLARVGEAPIGMVNLLEFTRMPAAGGPAGRWGYLGNMFVRPEHRDAGIGRRLLDAVVAEARRRDHVRVVLSPSERSVPFYGRAGFGPADELLVRRLD